MKIVAVDLVGESVRLLAEKNRERSKTAQVVNSQPLQPWMSSSSVVWLTVLLTSPTLRGSSSHGVFFGLGHELSGCL